ncbi:MAG: capsular polysaccharide biosynthesis protein [Verrucomicrobiaceae bacterium]|nr:MAG: capsular polysaccharide biosynthesis protein [Verrucomicrobiaceae bacterium]
MYVRKEIQIGWLYRKLLRHPLLEEMLRQLDPPGGTAVGWGYRPSGLSARRRANREKGPLLLLEDALVRSMKPGSNCVYGLVADSKGIYYDAGGASDLTDALNSGKASGWMRSGQLEPSETERLLKRYREGSVSKYNWYPGDFRSGLPDEPGVMVVDQTRGDASLARGGMSTGDFDRMVRDALDEHPGETIYLRAHPDHRYRNKHSCFSPWVYSESRVKLLAPDLSPASCFRFCREIYAGTSLMGMEGLIHGCKVKTYGWNFHAGWGLTTDRCSAPRPPRDQEVSLTRLFEAAYLQYCHYFDPDSGDPCGLDRVLEHLEVQRAVARENAGVRITAGWAPWKREVAGGFFHSPGTTLMHASSVEDAAALCRKEPDGKVLLWGATPAPADPAVATLRVEDGFLRSSGLGATFHRPLSWVLDDEGIYFDPRTPSRLETILETTEFTTGELGDAAELLAFLKEHRLTKYNVGNQGTTWDRSQAGGRKVILVPGQVEADASIKCGSPDLVSNGDLLQRVRELEPEAFLIFKAHPDLVAKARHGSVVPSVADHLADLIVTEGNVLEWLDLCDEVHTMTSTTGFEAILRGVPVTTHGLPFYAGWGLSNDRLPCQRRTRRLTVEELVCGALILYPRYLNPESGEFTTGIRVARMLARGGNRAERRPWHLRLLLILKNRWVALAR